MRYQTQLPTIALAFKENHQAAITIPEGKMIDLVGRAKDQRFVVVEVDGERLQMFETDLADRCIAEAAPDRAKAEVHPV